MCVCSAATRSAYGYTPSGATVASVWRSAQVGEAVLILQSKGSRHPFAYPQSHHDQNRQATPTKQTPHHRTWSPSACPLARGDDERSTRWRPTSTVAELRPRTTRHRHSGNSTQLDPRQPPRRSPTPLVTGNRLVLVWVGFRDASLLSGRVLSGLSRQLCAYCLSLCASWGEGVRRY